MELIGSRPYVLLASGNYSRVGEFVLGENGHLIGDAAAPPTLRNGDIEDSSVVRIAAGADAVIENLRIGDANSTLNGLIGNGISCSSPATLSVRNVEFFNNQAPRSGAGIYASGCQLRVVNSKFIGNRRGIFISGAVADVEGSTFLLNNTGVDFVSGTFEIRNSIVARSTGVGLAVGEHVGTVVEFNTIVDNATGVQCGGLDNRDLALDNNIIARNPVANVTGPRCSANTSLVLSGIAGINFVRPDLQPYDYHIGPGSSAIDQAIGGDTNVIDIDGEPRPSGPARDLGADEIQ